MFAVETPAIRTVSNGSSIYSVMYAGSGNKITIKRKAASVEDKEHVQKESESSEQSSVSSLKCIPSSHLSYGSSPKKSKSNKVLNHNFKTLKTVTSKFSSIFIKTFI